MGATLHEMIIVITIYDALVASNLLNVPDGKYPRWTAPMV